MDIEDLESQPVDEYEQPAPYPTDQTSEAARPDLSQKKNVVQAPPANENVLKPNQPGDQSNPAPAGAPPLVEWKFTNPAANGLLTSPNTVKNPNQSSGLNYSSYPELVQTYNATWQRNFQYILGPANPIFIDAKLSYQDIAWGYRLEPNPNVVLWRVSAAGIPNPDDYNNFIEQNRVIESTNNRTIAEIKPLIDTADKAGTGEKTQGSSKAGTSLFNGPLLASAGMSDVDPYFLGAGTEYPTDSSIPDYISDKWREFVTWRERQKYLQALEMTKLSLKTFYGITPDYPGYEDILAVSVKEYLRIQEETPALLMGAQGPITKFVYISRTTNGVIQYAGITNIFARRAAEHLRTKGIDIEPLMNNLSPRDAHAVEQALIEIHGLGSKGGILMNKINSIAKSNPEYGILVQRGYELLKSIDYGGLIP